MKKLRVYLDTSVVGGCFDPEFQVWSNALVADFLAERLLPVVSELVAAEVQVAPLQVQEKFDELLSLGAELLKIDRNAWTWRRSTRDTVSCHCAFATICFTSRWQRSLMWTCWLAGTSNTSSGSRGFGYIRQSTWRSAIGRSRSTRRERWRPMKNEELRTVEMTRRIRDQMYEETKDLGMEELIRYIQQRSEAASRRVEEREAILGGRTRA